MSENISPAPAKPAPLAERLRSLWQAFQALPLVRDVRDFVNLPGPEEYKDPAFDFLNGRRLARTGLIVTVVFVVGFLGWAGIAPLDSALMAPGVIVVETHRKDIQHLEGGIVDKIFVKEGQTVRSGQLLVQLNDTEARASLDMLRGEADALVAQEARLDAERDGSDHIDFPPDLLARSGDPKVAEAIHGEQSTFDTRRQTLIKQSAIYNQRSDENGRIIAGLQKEQDAVDTQISLINQETASVQQLYAKGLSTLPRLLALQRQAADLAGQRGQVVEKIAQVQLDSGENQLQIINLKNQMLSDVVKDLRDVQTRRFDLLDKLHAANDIVARLHITAPVEGRVVSLTVHTKGQVVKPGETIMEIVPTDDKLDVEAHMRPEDADEVHPGMTARVNFSSYKQRRLPIIKGVVTNVSADRITDERTGQAYFNVDVSVDRKQTAGYADLHLMPGVPVEVAVDTGSRTAIEYLIEPITAVFRNGMREK